MIRYILLSFAFLGWAFYEASGGAEFEPHRMGARDADPVPKVATNPVANSVTDPVTLAATAPVTSGLENTPTSYETLIALAIVPAIVPAVVHIDSPADAPRVAPAVVQSSAAQAGLTIGASAAPPVIPMSEVPRPRSETILSTPQLTPATAKIDIARIEPATEDMPGISLADAREVRGSRVNMRAGPGTAYGVLATLTRGTKVEVLREPGNGWAKLRVMDSGQIGWMSARLLTPPTSAAETQP